MKLISFFSKKNSALGFSLVCSVAYFVIITRFILNFTNTGGGFLVFLFAPAIICGGALFVFKAIKTYIEYESHKPLLFLFWGHITVIALAIVMMIEMIIL